MQDADQKIKKLMAVYTKILDNFIAESGFTYEQGVGKSREQWLRDHEAELRKEYAAYSKQAKYP